MKSKPGISGVLWMAAGAIVLLVALVAVLHVHEDQDPAARLAFKARRVDLAARMQSDLASASDAAKTAVLATTDDDSRAYADQARAASASVERERRELGELLTAGGTRGERDRWDRFTAAFSGFQRVDDDLLALAVKNTNVKAYGLAFGPAAAAVKEMNAALDRLVVSSDDAPDAKTRMRFAFRAETGALRIETLLPPHIAEENDGKMDELEASMDAEDARVRESLDGLGALSKAGTDAWLATATARYAGFTALKTQILSLSRENTNVRSLSISLNEKRKATLACEDALGALHDAILAEPIAGVTYGAPARPR